MGHPTESVSTDFPLHWHFLALTRHTATAACWSAKYSLLLSPVGLGDIVWQEHTSHNTTQLCFIGTVSISVAKFDLPGYTEHPALLSGARSHDNNETWT